MRTHCVLALTIGAALAGDASRVAAQDTNAVRFIVIADVHYGISRSAFRGATNVPASKVNAAMRTAINALPLDRFPNDGGLEGGQLVGGVDFVAVAGDIANRSENGVQSAKTSWAQFTHDYLVGLTLRNAHGERTPVWAIPGNHDASNAVGYTKPLFPSTDATVMVQLYNRMTKPVTPRTVATYKYATDKVHFSREVRGFHFSFLNIWPDSAERVWLDGDLRGATAGAPVILFAHVPPAGDPKMFTYPVSAHGMSAMNKFENLLGERFKDAPGSSTATLEARAFALFVRDHPRIRAYFHGHNNANEFYTFTGPDSAVALKVFRVDSPMKGKRSAEDESKLSFQIVVIAPKKGTMTVREYRWNAPRGAKWGASSTVSLR